MSVYESEYAGYKGGVTRKWKCAKKVWGPSQG